MPAIKEYEIRRGLIRVIACGKESVKGERDCEEKRRINRSGPGKGNKSSRHLEKEPCKKAEPLPSKLPAKKKGEPNGCRAQKYAGQMNCVRPESTEQPEDGNKRQITQEWVFIERYAVESGLKVITLDNHLPGNSGNSFLVMGGNL